MYIFHICLCLCLCLRVPFLCCCGVPLVPLVPPCRSSPWSAPPPRPQAALGNRLSNVERLCPRMCRPQGPTVGSFCARPGRGWNVYLLLASGTRAMTTTQIRRTLRLWRTHIYLKAGR
ncbi:hypothetical protein BKA80DRAFT_116452 [Phyllosticta citrichinensis]